MMNIAAVTMVYQEYNMLKRWYHHYGQLVGYDNLYVVSHGGDEKHREIAPRASFISIPRKSVKNFDVVRLDALKYLQFFLEPFYDCVLRTDTDEFVFVDPALYGSLAECLEDNPADGWFCVGFNVIEAPGEKPVDFDKPLSESRVNCIMSSVYSKAVVARNGVVLKFHGAVPKNENISALVFAKGLYLAHAKLADSKENDLSNKHRIEVKSINSPSNPKGGWANPAKIASDRKKTLMFMPLVDGDEAFAQAYEYFTNNPLVNRWGGPKVLGANPMKGTSRFILPERMVGAF